jgi:dsDNA-specific endonuclease/ATPase MutS2
VENVLLLSIFGVLALYFFSSMNIYKSMNIRMAEEKQISDNAISSLESTVKKYEYQVKVSIETITDSQESLEATRDELQKFKISNSELEHKNKQLEARVEELYTSIGSI